MPVVLGKKSSKYGLWMMQKSNKSQKNVFLKIYKLKGPSLHETFDIVISNIFRETGVLV